MKLTDGEKLIALMLSDLYQKLDIKGEFDPCFIRSAISNNHLWGIPWKYGGIPFESTDAPNFVYEVMDILEMWYFIEESYQKLSSEDKAKLEKEASPYGKKPKFTGFDGNKETEYMSIAQFLVNDLSKFESLKGRNFNSHVQSIGSYQRMLLVFKPMIKRLNGQDLPVDNLIAILNANRQPPAIKNK